MKLQFYVMLLIMLTIFMCIATCQKKQTTAPDKTAISWKMSVDEKDQLSYLPMKVDSIAKKENTSLPSVKKVIIPDSDIQEMVNIIVELNGIQNPNLIHNGQLLLCQFPDNKHFQFLEEVLPSQSLWTIVEHLLEVTSTYRPVYYSNSKPKK